MPACCPGIFILLVLLLPGAQGVRLGEIENLYSLNTIHTIVIMSRNMHYIYKEAMKIIITVNIDFVNILGRL